MKGKDKILELRIQKLTYQAIGEQLGISKQRVHQLLTGYKSPKWRENKRDNQKRFRQTEAGKVRNRESQKRFLNRIKVLVLTHYGNGKLKCVMCGFKDIRTLTIDHIKGGGGKHKRGLNLGAKSLYKWLIANNYPEGFQTLCMNCQWIKRYTNNEWGRTKQQ